MLSLIQLRGFFYIGMCAVQLCPSIQRKYKEAKKRQTKEQSKFHTAIEFGNR